MAQTMVTWVRIAVAAGALGLGLLPPDAVAQTGPRSVPAEFLYPLAVPGAQNGFLRPSALFVDAATDEILVADAGKNRIVIFGGDGRYRFEFSGGDRLSTPLDVAADAEGFIYILGSTVRGRRVLRYDFDGAFVDEVGLPSPSADSPVIAQSLTIDGAGRLRVLDSRRRILTYDLDGTLEHAFSLADGRGRPIETDEVVGAITVSHGLIFVPVSSRGTVYVYDEAGRWLRSLGYQGGTLGELSFPVRVAVTRERLVLVLDNHRFNVLAFDFEGRFLGEFGGRGMRPGWYYHPTLLAVDRSDRVYIGQVFQDRVDVCGIPEFIRDMNRETVVGPEPGVTAVRRPGMDILVKGTPIE